MGNERNKRRKKRETIRAKKNRTKLSKKRETREAIGFLAFLP